MQTPDNRRIWIEDAGPPDGFPVLVHPGSPGSRRLFAPAAKHAAAEHGFRLISFDRPGYGDRLPRPGRRIADGADDARTVAAQLGITRLAVWGFSGGGPYALACAALLPDLVTAGCVFASLAPYDAAGLDWSAGWSAEHQREVELFFTDPDLAREHFRTEAAEGYEALTSIDGWLSRWGDAAETDAAHSRELAEYLALSFRDSLTQGDVGWWEDWVAYLRPWGFDLDTIRVPVQLWSGERDLAVPSAHGQWLADHIPDVDAHHGETDDHATISIDHECEAFDFLNRHSQAVTDGRPGR